MPERSPSAALAASLAGLSGEVRDEIDRLARLGYRGVVLDATRPDLRPRALDRAARRAALATFRRSEVFLAGIDLWIPPGDLIDEVRCSRAVEAIGAAIELAADLGRVPVNLLLPDAAPTRSRTAAEVPAGTARSPIASPAAAEELRRFIESPLDSPAAGTERRGDELVDRLAATLGELLRLAERFGVDLVDHSIQPEGRARAHDAAVSDRLQIGIDPAMQLSRGIDPVEAVIRASATRSSTLGGARLCDLTRSGMRAPIADVLCGSDARDAQLDPVAYAAALSAAGVTTPVVDARRWPDPWMGIARSIEVWRRAALA